MKGVGPAKTDLGQEPLSLRADAWAIGARAKRPCLAWEQGPLKGILRNAAGSIIPSPTWPVLPTPSAVDSDFEDKSWSEVVPPWEPRAAKWLKSSLHSSSWLDVLGSQEVCSPGEVEGPRLVFRGGYGFEEIYPGGSAERGPCCC